VVKQKAVKTKASEADKKGRASGKYLLALKVVTVHLRNDFNVGPDDLIQFRQLRVQSVQGGIEVDLMDADDISRAIGADGSGTHASFFGFI